jgi:hypothetical protein
MITPVLLPALLSLLGAERLFLADADDPDSARIDAVKFQSLFHRLGAAFT